MPLLFACKIAVIENEIGSLGVDGALVANAHAEAWHDFDSCGPFVFNRAETLRVASESIVPATVALTQGGWCD